MSFLFPDSSSKKVKAPKPQSPVAIATEVSPQVQAQTQSTRKRLLAKRGRAGTVLTDNTKRAVLG